MRALDYLTTAEIPLDHNGVGYRGNTLIGLRGLGLPEGAILGAVRARLAALVDERAETLRGAVMTPGAGQAMEYQEVQAQAAAALASPSGVTEAAYSMLAASIGIDLDPQTGAPATDVLGVARSVEAAYGAWLTFGAGIRRARLSGKAAINAAASVDTACDAFDAIAWPVLG